ncbi:outer membrane beta-barrel protein [Pontibacter chitinilyticus]|uniref:outer membrane beta-barrel protein n=1 Tax=Pontibacter chitinilyticus TaxID=2674989 RepID=UPI00321A4637
MKRLLLITAIFMAAATGVFAKNGLTLGQRFGDQDTIVIKMSNGAKMTLLLQNKEQLKAFQHYSLDSLMRKLDQYMQRVDSLEQTSKNGSNQDMTVTFSTDSTQEESKELITISVQESGNKTGTNKEHHEIRINKTFKIDVDVEEDGDDTNVNVSLPNKAERDSARTAYKEEHPKTTKFDFDVDLGLNNFVNTNSQEVVPDLKPFGSKYVSLNMHLNSQIGGRKSPLHLVSGFEFAFNNYMFEKNYVVEDVNDFTIFRREMEVDYEKSKLTHSSVNVPLMPVLQFKRENGKDGFTIGAGGFVGYRLGSHAKLKYEEDGNTQKDKIRSNYNLQDFQYGLEGVVGYGSLNLFVKYNMNDLFKDNRGPQVNVVSFGIRLLE